MQIFTFFLKFINWYVLIITFVLGLIFNVGISGEKTNIFIYPTLDNSHLFQVQDHAGTCFSFKPNKVKCADKIINIPIQ